MTRTLNVLTSAGLSSGFERFVAKYKEMILAFRIEREFTKEEILELYLNTSFFGQRSYGVATAAQTYFGKTLGELTVGEIAILAGIPQRPTAWNPACQRRTRHRAPRLCAATHERNRAPSTDQQYTTARCRARRRQAVWCAAAARSVLRGGDGSSRDGRALRHAGYDGRAQSHDHHRQPSASGGQSCHPRHVDGLRRAARLPWADRDRRASRRRRRGGVAGGNHSRAVARVARRLPDAARLRERDRASR